MEVFLGPDNYSLVVDPAGGLERLQGHERAVRDRRERCTHPHDPVAERAARPVREPHPVRLGRQAALIVRVLVTGAAGFVGSRVARALVRSGYDVHALVREPGRRLDEILGDIRLETCAT